MQTEWMDRVCPESDQIKFKRSPFIILTGDGSSLSAKVVYNGYITSDTPRPIAIHKSLNTKGWSATDVWSGISIIPYHEEYRTRKDLVENISFIATRVQEMLKKYDNSLEKMIFLWKALAFNETAVRSFADPVTDVISDYLKGKPLKLSSELVSSVYHSQKHDKNTPYNLTMLHDFEELCKMKNEKIEECKEVAQFLEFATDGCFRRKRFNKAC